MKLILAGIFLAAVSAGFIVWLRNPRLMIYRSFLGVCLSGGLWILTNLIFSVTDGGLQYASALVSYGAVGLFATYFVVFSLSLAGRDEKVHMIFLPGISLSVLSSLPGVVASGVLNDSMQTTPGIFLYAFWVITSYSYGVLTLFRARSTASKIRRSQIGAVLNGILLTLVGASICNLVLPLLGNYSFVLLGPAFSIIFVGAFAHSILHYHLFDIKVAIARVVAYGLSVAILGGGVGYMIYIVANTALYRNAPVYFVAAGILIAATFSVFKKFFDFLTRRVFLNSTYDTQEAIDKVTALFSSVTNTTNLENETAKLLANILGATKVTIIYGKRSDLTAYMKRTHKSIIIKDELMESDESKLFDSLESIGAALLAPLITERQVIGYLCIGERTNGSSFTTHDVHFIDIVADELAIALQNSQRLEEISHFNDKLQAEIQDATAALRRSNKKLQQIDTTKDEFISMASHQLRTPLTSVKGYLSMVLEGDAGEINPQQRKLLEEAFASSQRMVYLIGDFLNVSRIQTGKFELERSSVSLPNIIAEEISQLRATAGSRGIELAYQPPHDFPLIDVDENKIRQVMMNFIDNAIYYSPEHTRITISLTRFADRIEFRVVDQGIGVPKEARQHLFTKFYRADNAKKQRPDGTGIGLFMAKKVVVEHGGAILFESEPGHGSVFGFRLPYSSHKKIPLES